MAIDFSFLHNRQPEIIGEGHVHEAAVCIPLIDRQNGPALLFQRRSEKIDQQPGDICFPGGAIEAGETPQEAAVREMTEELLVSEEQIELLGPGDLLVGDSVRIHSFVARLRGYDGRFSKDEVAEVFEVPLRFFLETKPDAYEIGWKPDFPADFPFDKIYGGRDYQWGSHAYTVLFYEYGGHVIWGMTAKITNAFAALCRREGL